MENGIDYREIEQELIDAYVETDSKVGSWQKKILLLILKTLITLVSEKGKDNQTYTAAALLRSPSTEVCK